MKNPFMAIHEKMEHNERYQINCMLALQAQISAVYELLIDKGILTREEVAERRAVEEQDLQEEHAAMQRRAVEQN